MSELFQSSSGSALRRLLVSASPQSLVPPSAVRAIIVKATRETFARSVSQLTPGAVIALALKAVKSFFSAIFSAKKKNGSTSESTVDHTESCAFHPEGSSEEYNCKVNSDKRRMEIARLMVRSKLAAPSGLVSAAALLVLFGWAAVTGTVLGVARGIRLRIIKALGGGGSWRDGGERRKTNGIVNCYY